VAVVLVVVVVAGLRARVALLYVEPVVSTPVPGVVCGDDGVWIRF
jgi:hypothetical protein